MQHLIFTSNTTYKIALLIKQAALNEDQLRKYYIDPLKKAGVLENSIIAYSLSYNDKNKAPAKLIKESLQNILKACNSQGITTIFVADGSYFKTLTKERKSEPHYGYVLPCKIKDYEYINVVLVPNYQALFYNPDLQNRIDLSIGALADHEQGTASTLGKGIIHSADYPNTMSGLEAVIHGLHAYPVLTCDIEGYGLSLKDCGLATIAFAWNKHEGVAFKVITKNKNEHIRNSYEAHTIKLLIQFFNTYQGTLIFHSASFDIKQIIFNLYMHGDFTNFKATIRGLNIFYRSMHDTKILVYLATNNAQGNHLSLKHNAFEFAGNYAKDDIKDISLIPISELLEYNLVDALATWYVFDKFYPKVIEENQLQIYNEIMLPSLKVNTKMELVGMPLSNIRVNAAADQLDNILSGKQSFIANLAEVKQWQWEKQLSNFISGNAALKTKSNPISKYAEEFNPNSTKHVRELLYDQLGLEIVDKTATGLAAVGAKTLNKLSNQLISEFGITEEDLK